MSRNVNGSRQGRRLTSSRAAEFARISRCRCRRCSRNFRRVFLPVPDKSCETVSRDRERLRCHPCIAKRKVANGKSSPPKALTAKVGRWGILFSAPVPSGRCLRTVTMPRLAALRPWIPTGGKSLQGLRSELDWPDTLSSSGCLHYEVAHHAGKR